MRSTRPPREDATASSACAPVWQIPRSTVHSQLRRLEAALQDVRSESKIRFVVLDKSFHPATGTVDFLVKMANRFEALEPIRQGVCEHFGAFEKNIAEGLSLRHDHGSQYVSDDFQNEIAFLGVQTSPSFVREPQGNGCAERFIRTLKENLLWVKHFSTVEELRLALLEFRDTYNQRSSSGTITRRLNRLETIT